MQRLNAQYLKAYLAQAAVRHADDTPLLLDVREPLEYEYCNIAESKLVPMGEIPGIAHTLDPERDVVLICHHGVRSYRIACYLESIGFAHVINLEGGIDAWAREVDPSIKRY